MRMCCVERVLSSQCSPELSVGMGVRGCVVRAPAYALSLNYAGCLIVSSIVFSFFGYGGDVGQRHAMQEACNVGQRHAMQQPMRSRKGSHQRADDALSGVVGYAAMRHRRLLCQFMDARSCRGMVLGLHWGPG